MKNIYYKGKKLPKIILNHSEEVIAMYFTIPPAIRLKWKQIFLRATDKFTFGPLKGKTFQSLINSDSEEMRLYYRDKFLLATKNTELISRTADFFNPSNGLPNEIDVIIDSANPGMFLRQ